MSEERDMDIAGFEGKIEILESRIESLRAGFEKLRDCDFVITPADRMDAVRKIAREYLDKDEKEANL